MWTDVRGVTLLLSKSIEMDTLHYRSTKFKILVYSLVIVRLSSIASTMMHDNDHLLCQQALAGRLTMSINLSILL